MKAKRQLPRLEERPRRTMSVEERADALVAACRTAMQILADSPDAAARLSRTEPVPTSTVVLLRRLAATRDE